MTRTTFSISMKKWFLNLCQKPTKKKKFLSDLFVAFPRNTSYTMIRSKKSYLPLTDSKAQ